jgi:hypothetical protein
VAIAFQDATSDVFIFDRKEVAEAADEILNENGIRFPSSPDVKDLLKEAR